MKKIILIIEDEIALANNLKLFFDNSGFEAHCAYDGQSGIKLAKEIRPTLTICDIMLPDIDGYEVFRKLYRLFPAMPFIFLTAKGEKEDIRKGMSLGADDYISKPFDFEDLLQSVKKRIEKQAILVSYVKLSLSKQDNSSDNNYILVQDKNAKIKILYDDILYVCYFHPYSELNLLNKKKFYLRATLKKLLESLPQNFAQISKNSIVNCDYIIKIERDIQESKYLLFLSNLDNPLSLSKKYYKQVMRLLKK